MRFTIAVVAGFAALASAATSVSIDPAQSSYVACIDACDPGDVKCLSYCDVVPSPNDAQANATNNCVANCDQGDGSEKETAAYATCVQDCISNNYFKTSSGTPKETDSSSGNSKGSGSSDSKASATGSSSGSDNTASAGASASGSESTDASKTDSSDSSSSGTATGSSSSSTSSDNAAAGLAIGSASILGFIVAVLAL
ncbi:hypothetical protein BKA56DRAFT_566783 [Ilyonectria sp. MPI-CAGE-AT-0026]|nr:hypothetical protein BKA56DRAFT_566783 [Ilyonectria sp. MPI-CAGE-AT-0026]